MNELLLRAQAATRPIESRNALARLLLQEPNVGGNLPDRPAREIATNPTPQVYDSQRLREDGLRELLDPSSTFNRFAGGFVTNPATINVVRGAGRGLRAFHGSPNDFDVFDFSRVGSGATEGYWAPGARPTPSAYLTTSADHAALYGNPLEFEITGRLMNFNARQELSRWAREMGYGGAQRMVNNYYDGDVYRALDADRYFADSLRRALADGFTGARIRMGDLIDYSAARNGVPVGDVIIIGAPEAARRVR